jgi:DNA-binding PadR family transcriptional regulator
MRWHGFSLMRVLYSGTSGTAAQLNATLRKPIPRGSLYVELHRLCWSGWVRQDPDSKAYALTRAGRIVFKTFMKENCIALSK